MSKNTKFFFVCRKCGEEINGFEQWFASKQQCPQCGHKVVDTHYHADINELKKLIFTTEKPDTFWHYFDFLPLIEKQNIVSKGEGAIPVERWEFLEEYARNKFNINIEVIAYRNDMNNGTGTFKDVAGSMVASVLNEHHIEQYCVASTGNIGSAFSHYLAMAGVNLAAFIPREALTEMEAEMGSYAQRVFRVEGDYAKAKQVAAEYSKKFDILMSGGNLDPARIESKRTMVFEWLRQMGKLPSVYIQALSGGTGPFAIEKALNDLAPLQLGLQMPRFVLVQADGCAPMAHAYQKAKQNNFPEGFENQYPIYENPVTKVPILATGNPATYPLMSNLVHRSKGDIIEFAEADMLNVARLIAYETGVRIGPASTIAVGGFFEALRQNLLKEGDSVLLNIGEGVRRAIRFMEEMIYTTQVVDSVDECTPPNRKEYKNQLWEKFDKFAK